jgi:NitT/TauT family transport system substrate-binding protein
MGRVDFEQDFPIELIGEIDAHEPITIVAGVHAGCQELFAGEGIRSITDLKGRSVGIRAVGTSKRLINVMASYVGLDPDKDIRWVETPSVSPLDLFVAGKIDAFLARPPEPQELRARNIGHVVVNSSVDHPWSQYFCCMIAGNKDFVRKYPVATRRVIRAILKGADLCASAPNRAAQLIVDRGFTPRYDYALQTLNDVRYGVWRDYDPEDTLRFYALRLQELGMIKSSPQKIIAEGTDWRFLNELKRELKT